MARYINAVDCADIISERFNMPLEDLVDVFAEIPTADVVEVKTIKAWLHEIAINNINDDVKLTLFATCQDIISRLDGLRKFAQERRNT